MADSKNDVWEYPEEKICPIFRAIDRFKGEDNDCRCEGDACMWWWRCTHVILPVSPPLHSGG